ncbi:MAG: YceG family protein, partial [Anaeromassilibacillus sp.]
TQDYILEKIQALIDYDLIVNGGPDVAASMLSVLMNLDKELLRLLQNFDFTKSIPKFLVVDVTEKVFTLEECILLAFLNLVGFDIAIFTPTGYRNVEKYLTRTASIRWWSENLHLTLPSPICGPNGTPVWRLLTAVRSNHNG